jgi:hypothetical protein
MERARDVYSNFRVELRDVLKERGKVRRKKKNVAASVFNVAI